MTIMEHEIFINTYLHPCIYIYICIYYIHICIYILIWSHTHTYIYIYINMYTHVIRSVYNIVYYQYAQHHDVFWAGAPIFLDDFYHAKWAASAVWFWLFQSCNSQNGWPNCIVHHVPSRRFNRLLWTVTIFHKQQI